MTPKFGGRPPLSFDELYLRLQKADEDCQIEAKQSTQLGDAAQRTICAFANEPGGNGGYLLLGIRREAGSHGVSYTIVGVPNPDKLQADIANQCVNVFNHPIRPPMAVHTTDDGKRVVVVYVPESDRTEKPIYLQRLGIPKGAFRRIGSADHRCTDEDLALLYSLREGSFDAGVMSGATIADIDRDAVREYRRARHAINPTAEELSLKLPEFLIALGAAVLRERNLKITRAGLLLFGRKSALRRLCPSVRVDYVLVPGTEWVPDPKQRYSTVEVRLPLVLAIQRLVDLVSQDLPKAFRLKGRRTRREEIPTLPYEVIREGIVNAVMHREYRKHDITQIIKFSDRLEIRNPGHSLKPTSELGSPGSVLRNPCIAAVLHESGFAESKGTGIMAMRKLMHRANLSAPEISSDSEQGRFQLTLQTHHLVDEDTMAWLGHFAGVGLSENDSRSLIVVKRDGYITNSVYREINSCDPLVASAGLRRLRSLGLLKAHGKGNAVFYTFSNELEARALNSKGKTPLPMESRPGRLVLSPENVDLLRRIGERGDKRLIEVAIIRLCAMRPMGVNDLSKYLKRHPVYLNRQFMVQLMKEGSVSYLYPGSPNHPRQKYRAAPHLADLPIPAPPKRPRAVRVEQPPLLGLLADEDE